MGFDLIAAAYDILSDPGKRVEREGAFLRTLAAPGTRVLDLACGTGVHAQFLAAHGAEVMACDLSPGMIAQAAHSRPHPRVRYEVRDMRTPPPGPFDLALCLGNSINLLPDAAAVQAMLQAVKAVLAPGGRLLLHAINPACRSHAEPSLVRKSGEADGREVVICKTLVPWQSRRFLMLAYFWRPARSGKDWQSQTEASVLLDLGAEDLRRCLATAGFGDVSAYGSMEQSDFSPELSPDTILLAK